MELRTTLLSINRQPNSPDGNPRYTLDCEGAHTYWTKPDTALNHVLNTDEYAAMIGEPVILTTERAGESRHVYGIRLQFPEAVNLKSITLTPRQRQLAMCIMTNGYETGIGYWVLRAKDIKRDSEGEYEEFTLKAEDYDEPNPWFTVTPEKVWIALKKIATRPEYEGTVMQEVARKQIAEDRRLGPGHTGADCYLASTWADAASDDAVIQVACFDTVVYG